MELTKAQKDRMAKLVAALRSGEYKQGTDGLHPGHDRFCCLGVACDLYVKSKRANWEDTIKTSYYLPEEVMEYFGFANSNPVVEVKGIVSRLANLNDDLVSFRKIADYIEQTYLGGGK